eukprot:TRINITY_DN26285_c0_g1_i1.p1 TRINITY_DN26285_c0_g1~~TRINITY_DN26285_c0_g1_i1.p1  ORF type:complete len:104 (+),score=12.93 TRINITY_DN26285_c0_g1_i1:177-488(+)
MTMIKKGRTGVKDKSKSKGAKTTTQTVISCSATGVLSSCLPTVIGDDDLPGLLSPKHHHTVRILASKKQQPLSLCRAVSAFRQANFDFWKAQDLLSKKVSFSC